MNMLKIPNIQYLFSGRYFIINSFCDQHIDFITLVEKFNLQHSFLLHAWDFLYKLELVFNIPIGANIQYIPFQSGKT